MPAQCVVRWLFAQKITFEYGEEEMVLPGAVDQKIGAGETFTLEPELFEQAARAFIVGSAGRLDAVQSHVDKDMAQEGADSLAHKALASVFFAHPIAERGALGHAAP